MIEILAPAKLNLGLEILGRRDDGYHEIRSVMVPVSLVDRVTTTPSDRAQLATGGLPVAASGNLVCRAMAIATATWGLEPVNATLTKRIPLSSGLGGGSSDAAATLLAMSHLSDVEQSSLAATAATIGSDVPFFFSGTTALVSGRGETVTAVTPHSPLHAVIVVPNVTIPRKTATMYASLARDDFSDGAAVAHIASVLPGLAEDAVPLPNAFRRALYKLVPSLDTFARRIEAATSLPAHLTGAGPAHFVLCRSAEQATSAARRLRTTFAASGVSIFAVRSMTGIHMREVADAERDA